MNIDQIILEVQEIFREVLDNEEIKVAFETTADDVDEWDSLTHIQLVMGIEQHFGIRFKSDEIIGFKNVGEMCQGIGEKLR